MVKPYLLDSCGQLKDRRGVADARNGEGGHAGPDGSVRSTASILCSDAARASAGADARPEGIKADEQHCLALPAGAIVG